MASVLFGSFLLLSLSFRRPFEPGGCKCGCVRYAHPELASRDAGVCVWREGVSETTAETERERCRREWTVPKRGDREGLPRKTLRERTRERDANLTDVSFLIYIVQCTV